LIAARWRLAAFRRCGDAALGSGANNTARYLGSAIGIALVVAVVAGGGHGDAGLISGRNHAALAAAAINLAGAALVAACRERQPLGEAASGGLGELDQPRRVRTRSRVVRRGANRGSAGISRGSRTRRERGRSHG
jgi:hypothetical protein